MYPEHVQRMLDKIQVDIKTALLKNFKDDINDEETRIRIANFIASKLPADEDDRKKLDFTVEADLKQKDNIIITPKNLYTHLLLHGIYIAPFEVEGKTTYETDFGTFVYDGKPGFMPNVILQSITVDITISPIGDLKVD
jgi:hypothetical protein